MATPHFGGPLNRAEPGAGTKHFLHQTRPGLKKTGDLQPMLSWNRTKHRHPPALKTIVLDDHLLVGQAIAGLLSEVAGLDVLGACTCVKQCSALMQKQVPDLLVLDVKLGEDSYRDAADLLLKLQPNAKLLFVTALGQAFQPPADLRHATISVVDKALGWHQLLETVEYWRSKYEPIQDNETRTMLKKIKQLPPREQHLIIALGAGLLNKEMAKLLALKEATVKSYRKQIASQLGVSGAKLVRLATLYRCWCLAEPET